VKNQDAVNLGINGWQEAGVGGATPSVLGALLCGGCHLPTYTSQE